MATLSTANESAVVRWYSDHVGPVASRILKRDLSFTLYIITISTNAFQTRFMFITVILWGGLIQSYVIVWF